MKSRWMWVILVMWKLSRNYILQFCLYLVSQSFHNLLQYTKDVFIVFEDSSKSKEIKKYFLHASMKSITEWILRWNTPHSQIFCHKGLKFQLFIKFIHTHCESLTTLTNNSPFTLVKGHPECLVLLKDIHPTIKQFKHLKTGTSLITASPNAIHINCYVLVPIFTIFKTCKKKFSDFKHWPQTNEAMKSDVNILKHAVTYQYMYEFSAAKQLFETYIFSFNTLWSDLLSYFHGSQQFTRTIYNNDVRK